MSNLNTYLALDFGGTKLLVGEVDACGNILRSKKYPTGHVDQYEALRIMKASIDDYIQTVGWVAEGPIAAGIGLIGRIDGRKGLWHQIDGQRNECIDLAGEISSYLGIPCHIDNDVKSATLAEMKWGKAAGHTDFVYINVGTGIAVGSVCDGRIIRGGSCNAGEAGHTKVGVNLGFRCVCGREDCVETIASGMGLDRLARHFSPEFPDSPLEIPSDARVDGSRIVELAKDGDSLCSKIVDIASQAIADLVMNAVRFTDPEIVVMGGSVVSDPYIFEKMLGKLNAHTIRFVTGGIVQTSLDSRLVGLLGAAAVAMQ